MEVDQSNSISSVLSSDMDDEDNERLLKNKSESMEPDILDGAEKPTHDDRFLPMNKTRSESCGNFEEAENKTFNDCFESRDDLQIERSSLQDSLQVTSTSPVYRENQKEEISPGVSRDRNCADPDIVLESKESIEEPPSLAEGCTENLLISNVDTSYNVNNVSTSNVNLTYPVPCDESSSSSSISDNLVYSSNNTSGECKDNQSLCRTDSGRINEAKELNIEINSNCASGNASAVDCNTINKGNTEGNEDREPIGIERTIDSDDKSDSKEHMRYSKESLESSQEVSSLEIRTEYPSLSVKNSRKDTDLINEGNIEEQSDIKVTESYSIVNEEWGENSNNLNESFTTTRENVDLERKSNSEEYVRHSETSVERSQELSKLEESTNYSSESAYTTKEAIQCDSNTNAKDLNFKEIGNGDFSSRPIDNYDHCSIATDSDQSPILEKMYFHEVNNDIERLHCASAIKSTSQDSQMKGNRLEDALKKDPCFDECGKVDAPNVIKNMCDIKTFINESISIPDNLEDNDSSVIHTPNNKPTSSDIRGKVCEVDLQTTLNIEDEPSDDSDNLNARIVDHTLNNIIKDNNPSNFDETCNMELNFNTVPYKTSRSESPLGTDTEKLTNDTKANEKMPNEQEENDDCAKLVDYADDGSEYDSLDSERDSDSLRIVDSKVHLVKDINRTDSTSVLIEIDHSKETEKSSINTYSEGNSIDIGLKTITARKEKLGLSLNPNNVENKIQDNTFSSSRNERLSINERPNLAELDFNSSSSDEDELSRSIEKVLLDNENSRTCDSNDLEQENNEESVEKNTNQRRIQLKLSEETSPKGSNNVKNISESGNFSSEMHPSNDESTSPLRIECTELDRLEKVNQNEELRAFSPERSGPTDQEKIENSAENVCENEQVRIFSTERSKIIDLKRIEKNSQEKVCENEQMRILSPERSESTNLERIDNKSSENVQVRIFSPERSEPTNLERIDNSSENVRENEQVRIFSPERSEPTNLERIDNSSENEQVRIFSPERSEPTNLEITENNLVEDMPEKTELEAICSKGNGSTDLERTENNSLGGVSVEKTGAVGLNRRKCIDMEGVDENIAESLGPKEEQSRFTKDSNNHNSLHSSDIIKSIEETIEKSKTEENDNRKSKFVTKIVNLILYNSHNIVNTSQESLDIVRKIENLIKECEQTTLSFSNQNTAGQLCHGEILEKIERILFESSENRKGSSGTKPNCKDAQEENSTSNNFKGQLTNESNYSDLEMGVFEESDGESTDSAEIGEKEVKDTPAIVPTAYFSEEESTDTAESDGEVEAFSIQQSKLLSTNSLKRRQSMNSMNKKQVPPAKKLALAHVKRNRSTKVIYLQCKQCNGTLPRKHFVQHLKNCKASLSNGVDTGGSETLLRHSVVDQVNNSTPSFSKIYPKPKSLSKSNSHLDNSINRNATQPLNSTRKNNSPLDIFPKNNSLSPVMVSPMNSDLRTKHASYPIAHHISILPKPNDSLENVNMDASVSKSPELNKSMRQVFLCAACHIYFEYWNLYLHMLEKHKRFICLYCLGMFGHSENLFNHIHKRHNLCVTYFANSNSASYKEYTSEKLILTCTTCGHVLEDNDMDRHSCDSDWAGSSSLNKSLNSSSGSYPDPESFMLATMTEGEDKRPQALEIITLDETSTVKTNDPEVGTRTPPPPLILPSIKTTATTTALSSLDKLTNTINEVAENRTEPRVSTSHNIESQSASATTAQISNPTPPPPLSQTNPPSFQDSASAALSELEKCHKLLIEERTSDEDTESEAEDNLLKNSMLIKTPEKSSEKSIDLAKPTNLDSASERLTSTDDDSDAKIQENNFNKIKDSLFNARVVLNKIDIPVERFPAQPSEDKSEISAVLPLQEEKSVEEATNVNISHHTINESQSVAKVSDASCTKEEISESNVSPSRKFSGQENEDDDDNRDFNDSDNENSLKIDDSVFEDDEEIGEDLPAEIALDVASLKPSEESHDSEVREVKKLSTFPAFKINPLRIKIKCGNSGDNQYERIKTETEIREKEARERRYDEAIDEVIRKSIAEYDMKESERERKEKEKETREMEREQKEKDEYERLQAELAKKQEEYQRIQEAYVSLQTRSESQDEHPMDDGEDEKENKSIDPDESLEETDESRVENAGPDEIQDSGKNPDIDTESIEKDNGEQVKLIERFQDEKSSLLKEELLKKCEKLFAGTDQLPEEEQESTEPPPLQLASEDIQPMALSLEDPLDNTDIKIVIKECLRTSCSVCVHCYHATRIVANGRELALHILAEHRYTPVKNDTSDDLIQFITSNLSKLDDTFFSSDTFDPTESSCFVPFDNIYYCLQCSFASKHQRELTSHKRKVHPKTSQICLMCKQILLNQSELLFHYCAGVNNPNPADNIYWCGICGLDKIPSAFRLMVHLRKKHNTCNVCLESCANESKLLQHMLKHKIIHMCYKCNISYRNKQDITKHLFWKHGTESIVCKRCLQKRWSHVYHFCQPPARFTCDECNLTFKSSSTLKVHKRIHAGIFPYECVEEGCAEKFVSKKLLEKHNEWHRAPPKPPTPPPHELDPNTAEPHIDVCNVDESASPVATLKAGGKSKKKKKSKFDLNNMNLPPLNLSSESDSSEDETPSEAPSTTADSEDNKPPADTEANVFQDETLNTNSTPISSEISEKTTEPSEMATAEITAEQAEDPVPLEPSIKNDSNVDMPDLAETQPMSPRPSTTNAVIDEEPPIAPTEIVPDVWDQFKSFTASLNVFRHVEDEHDYHVVYEKEEPPPESKPEDAAQPLLSEPSQESTLDVNVERKEGEEETVSRGDKSANSTLNKSTSGDDSSSDSSSSSSCGSQCGSNCSCSSSSSSSSSSSDDSSSDSDSSDTENRKRQEEKRMAKKVRKHGKKHSHASEQNVTIENEPEEGPLLHGVEGGETHVHSVTPAEVLPPPIAESDLETDVSSSDEDFYDEKPQASAPPRVEDKPTSILSSLHVSESPQQHPSQYPFPVAATSYPSASPVNYPPPSSHNSPASFTASQTSSPRTPSRNRKRKRPRMRNVPSSSSTPKHASSFKTSFKHPFMQPSPAFEKKPSTPLIASKDTLPPRSPTDDNTRSSKRKRKQNRFYGYSDDEEPGAYDNDESEEYAAHQPPLKRKLFWKQSPAVTDRIPPSSPPTYESKMRFEHAPLKMKIATDFAANPFEHPLKMKIATEFAGGHQQKQADYSSYRSDTTPEPAAPDSPSSSDEDPTVAEYNALAAMPPPPIVPEPGSVPLYCYCRCPYDEVSEMIACDGDDCQIEWYHFECVNILVPPKGKWYCPQCRPKYQSFGT